jgi:hypothetical protein
MSKLCLAEWVLWIASAYYLLLCLQPSATAQERLAAGQVNIDHSRIYVFVDKTGLVGHQHAIEGKLSRGELFLSGAKPGSLVFDMKSFDADTPRARSYIGLESTTDEPTRKKVNENMRGGEILSVNKFSTATFNRIGVKPKQTVSKRQLPEYSIQGEFTLHEKTKPVDILCDVEVKDGWHHIRGGFKILQSDYGIKPFSKMLGAVGVTDELTIYGDLWVVPE